MALAVIVVSISLMFQHPQPPESARRSLQSFYDRLIQQSEMVTADLDEGAEVVVLVLKEEIKLGGNAHFQRVYRSLKEGGVVIQHVGGVAVVTQQVGALHAHCGDAFQDGVVVQLVAVVTHAVHVSKDPNKATM